MNALIRMPNRIERFVRLPQAGDGGDGAADLDREASPACSSASCSRAIAVKGLGAFRVIRDSDVEIEEEAEDLVRLFETALKRRRRGSVIRLEIEAAMPADLRHFVQRALGAAERRSVPGRRRAWRSRICRRSDQRRPARSRIRAL